MFESLIKLANSLDKLGLISEANTVDDIFVALAKDTKLDYLKEDALSSGIEDKIRQSLGAFEELLNFYEKHPFFELDDAADGIVDRREKRLSDQLNAFEKQIKSIKGDQELKKKSTELYNDFWNKYSELSEKHANISNKVLSQKALVDKYEKFIKEVDNKKDFIREDVIDVIKKNRMYRDSLDEVCKSLEPNKPLFVKIKELQSYYDKNIFKKLDKASLEFTKHEQSTRPVRYIGKN